MRRGIGGDKVARPIADHRRTRPTEFGDDQFALLSRSDRLSCFGVNDLGNAGGFDDRQVARIVFAFAGQRTDFGHAPVIEDSGAPRGFDSSAHGRNRTTRFTSN